MDTRRIRFRRVVLLVVVACLGCSRGEPVRFKGQRLKTVPARGVVTIGGGPVEGATVIFSAVARDISATATTDKDGRFTLRTYQPGDGAVVGSHRVAIEKTTEVINLPADPEGNVPPPQITHHLPERFRDRVKSGLTAEVTEAGPNEFVLDLDAPARSR